MVRHKAVSHVAGMDSTAQGVISNGSIESTPPPTFTLALAGIEGVMISPATRTARSRLVASIVNRFKLIKGSPDLRFRRPSPATPGYLRKRVETAHWLQ